jgi:Na+/H+-dicarboxylate symporter
MKEILLILFGVILGYVLSNAHGEYWYAVKYFTTTFIFMIVVAVIIISIANLITRQSKK